MPMTEKKNAPISISVNRTSILNQSDSKDSPRSQSGQIDGPIHPYAYMEISLQEISETTSKSTSKTQHVTPKSNDHNESLTSITSPPTSFLQPPSTTMKKQAPTPSPATNDTSVPKSFIGNAFKSVAMMSPKAVSIASEAAK